MNEDSEKSHLSGEHDRFASNPFANPNDIDFEFNEEMIHPKPPDE